MAAPPVALRQRGLPPLLAADTRVLILGSFPSEASIKAAQYYAHSRNHFWPLLGALLDAPLPQLSYPERLACLVRHRVGLWDVITACERRGSLDSAIRNAQHAEIAHVRRNASAVTLVAFNGKTAAKAEARWRIAGYETIALPSSSPAYTKPLAEKLAAWRAISEWLPAHSDAPSTSSSRRPAPMHEEGGNKAHRRRGA